MRVFGILVLASACSFTPGRPGAGAADDDAAIDAVSDDTLIDTAGFTTAACPTTYDIVIASTTTTSRYHALATEASFTAQHQACAADHPGWTHLASLETPAEIGELRAYLGPATIAPSRRYYLGIVQQRDQATMTAGWLVFSGAALPPNQWSSGQPNDDDSAENNSENIATLNADDMLNDATGDIAYGALCECDGVAIAATIPPLLP